SDEGWEDWGDFTLAENRLAVHHRVREGQHRLELLRRADTASGAVSWETLDVVNLDLGENTLVCLSAKRNGANDDYVAVAQDDREHRHPVMRAWRIDTARNKLVVDSAEGVMCNAKEEPRTR
ncbi:MAG TPA: hypothetical protein VE010_11790, partial [Thermoanaerobaculia bacterium]|nr:hypothetical protein [Thermoanaerobaculia bacterium]